MCGPGCVLHYKFIFYGLQHQSIPRILQVHIHIHAPASMHLSGIGDTCRVSKIPADNAGDLHRNWILLLMVFES